MLKWLRNILSFAERDQSAKAHKMPVETELDQMLSLLGVLTSDRLEPSVVARQSQSVTVQVQSFGVLIDELVKIANAVEAEETRLKYYDTLPQWAYAERARTSLDDYLVTAEGVYARRALLLNDLERALQRILLSIDLEHNRKWKDYYLHKPNRVYQEVIAVLNQLIDND